MYKDAMVVFKLNDLCPRCADIHTPSQVQIVFRKSCAVLKQVVNTPIGKSPTLVVSRAMSRIVSLVLPSSLVCFFVLGGLAKLAKLCCQLFAARRASP